MYHLHIVLITVVDKMTRPQWGICHQFLAFKLVMWFLYNQTRKYINTCSRHDGSNRFVVSPSVKMALNIQFISLACHVIPKDLFFYSLCDKTTLLNSSIYLHSAWSGGDLPLFTFYLSKIWLSYSKYLL